MAVGNKGTAVTLAAVFFNASACSLVTTRLSKKLRSWQIVLIYESLFSSPAICYTVCKKITQKFNDATSYSFLQILQCRTE